MIKLIHLGFVFLVLMSFIARIILSETRPNALKLTTLKIAPHIIDTLLLISGITLVIEYNWLSRDYNWIIAKLILLFAYIGFGSIAMKQRGKIKWLAFTGALACLAYIGGIAIAKQAWLF